MSRIRMFNLVYNVKILVAKISFAVEALPAAKRYLKPPACGTTPMTSVSRAVRAK